MIYQQNPPLSRRDTSIKAVLSLVMSRLDYTNALLAGQSQAALRGLQTVQNYAVRVVVGLGPRDHVVSALRELHWLPVYIWVEFKMLNLVYWALNCDEAPAYLRDMVPRHAVAEPCSPAATSAGWRSPAPTTDI